MDYCFVVRRAVSCCALVIALFCPLIAEAALSAPVSLQATAISPSQMNLRWVNTATNATGYSVERSLTSTGGFVVIGTTGSKGTTYQSTGLASATTYYYRVWATGRKGAVSSYSNVASATTLANDTTPPSVPPGLTATAASCSQITLAWTSSTDSGGSGLKGYKVYRGGVFLQQVLAPTTSAADTGLSAATSYSYTVTAIDNAGNVSAQSSPASAVTPACPALTQTYLSDFATYQVPVLPRPVLRASLIDPVFGTTITRVTDPAMAPAGTSGPSSGLRHEYARFPVLSADNSKVVVQVLGGADGGVYEVRDLVSGALLYKINPVDDPELSWHPTDPTRLFYRRANEIRVFHTDTGQAETLMSFPQYYAIGTNEEGRPSDDWQYYAFLGYHDSSFSAADIVVVDLVAKQVIVTWANAGVPDWVSMSPSGNYVVAMWTNGPGTRLYTRTLSYVRTLFSDYAHSDFAFDANSNEVLVYDATSGNQVDELACPNPPNGSPIASARLFDGQKKILLGDCNKADWTPVITGTFLGWNWFTPHFSGIASRQHPGWVLVSTYTDPQNTQHPLAREIFWLKLDGSGQVRRLAHHHSDQGVDANGNKDYWAEPHATSAWDGSTILFASVWGQPFSEYDLYAVTGWWW